MYTEIYKSGYQASHPCNVIIISHVLYQISCIKHARCQVITGRCPVLSGDMPSDHTTSVSISSNGKTSDNTTDSTVKWHDTGK